MTDRVRPGPREALDLLRRMGPRWTVARAWHALRVRTGTWGRRFRPRPWDAWSLGAVAPGVDGASLRDRLERSVSGLPGGRRGDGFVAALREAMGEDGAASLRGEVGEILAGRQRLFGGPPVEVGFPPRWSRHPFTGEDAAMVPWSAIGDLGGADVKPLWEPGRFRGAFPLARAWRALGDGAAAEGFWSMVDDFVAANPPGTGPHWMCGQETAYRAVAWCFALAATLDSPAATEERLERITVALAVHGERIAATHSFARLQKNNHSLNEALGLVVLAATLPFLGAAPRWAGLAQSTYERELPRQVYADGSYVQQSLGYHRLAVESLALAFAHWDRLAPRRPLPSAFGQALARLTDFLEGVTDGSSGALPTYGSADGSRVFHLDTLANSDLRGVLAAVPHVSRGGAGPPPAAAAETSLWLWGRGPAPAATTAEPAPFSAPDGGYHVLRAGESWSLLRCGPLRDRPAHADMLHLTLMWNGHEVVGDPGTFSYDAAPPWDNGLATARVHNAPCIAGADPMDRGPRFLWFRWCDGKVLGRAAAGDAVDWITGEHRGYARRYGVTVRRTVAAVPGGLWVVVDDLLGDGAAPASSHWLFPRARVVRRDGTVFGLATPAGPMVAAFASSGGDGAPVATEVSAGEGDPADTRGWWAPVYGSREPAPGLVVSDDGPLPRRRIAVFDCGSGASLRRLAPDGVEARFPSGELVLRLHPPGAGTVVAEARFDGAGAPS